MKITLYAFWFGLLLIVIGEDYLEETMLTLAGSAIAAVTAVPAGRRVFRSLRAEIAEIRDQTDKGP